MKDVTIAYEPVWAIGTGLVCDAKVAQEVHKFIRSERQSASESAREREQERARARESKRESAREREREERSGCVYVCVRVLAWAHVCAFSVCQRGRGGGEVCLSVSTSA